MSETPVIAAVIFDMDGELIDSEALFELVRACQRAGLRVAVASSANRINIDANLARIGLPSASWDAVVSGQKVERKKPAPDIFLAAARELGVGLDACAVIADDVDGVTAAKAAGMRCLAVAQTSPPALLAGAHVVRGAIRDLRIDDIVGVEPFLSRLPPVLPPPLPPAGLAASPANTPAKAGPWGFWATAGFSAIITAAFVLVQTVVAVISVAANGISDLRRLGESIRDLESNGNYLAWATLASTPVMVGLSWVFAAARRRLSGITPREYLGLNLVNHRTLGLSCLAVIALWLTSDAVTLLLEKPIVPEVMVRAYQSAGLYPLLWLAIVVLAPLGEEFFFRGFMLPGLVQTRLGGPGAVALTAAAWAIIHLQYDLYGVCLIFVLGLLLGAVRLRTGSVVPCLILHALQNLLATIETAVVVAMR